MDGLEDERLGARGGVLGRGEGGSGDAVPADLSPVVVRLAPPAVLAFDLVESLVLYGGADRRAVCRTERVVAPVVADCEAAQHFGHAEVVRGHPVAPGAGVEHLLAAAVGVASVAEHLPGGGKRDDARGEGRAGCQAASRLAAFEGFRLQRVVRRLADARHEETLLVAEVLVVAETRERGGVGDEKAGVSRHRREAGADLLRRDLAGILRLFLHLGRSGGDGVHFGFRRLDGCLGDRRGEGAAAEQQRREQEVCFCLHAESIPQAGWFWYNANRELPMVAGWSGGAGRNRRET